VATLFDLLRFWVNIIYPFWIFLFDTFSEFIFKVATVATYNKIINTIKNL
jgi:hypothetical protein